MLCGPPRTSVPTILYYFAVVSSLIGLQNRIFDYARQISVYHSNKTKGANLGKISIPQKSHKNEKTVGAPTVFFSKKVYFKFVIFL